MLTFFFKTIFYLLTGMSLIHKRTTGFRFPKEMRLINSGFSTSHLLLKK